MESLAPQIDYTKVEPIPFQKTVAYVNHFVVQSTQFLNRFSFLCEQRLAQVSRHLERLEITMNTLEAKLNSIPEDALAPASSSSYTPTTTAGGENGDAADMPPPPPPRDEPEYEYEQPQQYGVGAGENSSQAEGQATVSTDPRYSQYFTMLRMRVPVAAIKQKMMLEGINPDILDNPDAPSDWAGNGAGAGTVQAAPAGGEYFSDEESDGEGW